MKPPIFELRKLLGWLLSFLILGGLLALFFQYRHHIAGAPRLSVKVHHLPYYAFCSFYRMLIAYLLSLIFAITYGLGAAKGGTYERVMIPAIDVAQSVPVVGFFPAAIYFFVALAHGSRVGVEMAAIFLIFTSQAWNLALGVYEAAKTVPIDSMEALDAFGASRWLKLKRLLIPAAVPKLVYNSILSWVAGWYFLIACEIITVGPANYRLPGLGSFLMEAADKGRVGELIAGLATLLAVIVVMDIFVWQPLSVWAEKFRYEFAATSEPAGSMWMADVVGGFGLALAHTIHLRMHPILRLLNRIWEMRPKLDDSSRTRLARVAGIARVSLLIALLLLFAYASIAGLLALFHALARPWPDEARLIPMATAASFLRLGIAYLISLAWTLPCALWAAESPRFNRVVAPIAEIAGSMPATALFPLIVVLVIEITGGMNLASVLLILTGMQWYLLFNLLAGMRQVPADLKEAARSFGLTRFATWRNLTVPALLPSLITGSITAWGGGWNALILSEYFVYHDHTYQVLGLGALLDQATYATGNSTMILLSLLSMIVAVMAINRLVWRRLYVLATERFKLDY
jgi:NitT/TauT family transport system permease protein